MGESQSFRIYYELRSNMKLKINMMMMIKSVCVCVPFNGFASKNTHTQL